LTFIWPLADRAIIIADGLFDRDSIVARAVGRDLGGSAQGCLSVVIGEIAGSGQNATSCAVSPR